MAPFMHDISYLARLREFLALEPEAAASVLCRHPTATVTPGGAVP